MQISLTHSSTQSMQNAQQQPNSPMNNQIRQDLSNFRNFYTPSKYIVTTNHSASFRQQQSFDEKSSRDLSIQNQFYQQPTNSAINMNQIFQHSQSSFKQHPIASSSMKVDPSEFYQSATDWQHKECNKTIQFLKDKIQILLFELDKLTKVVDKINKSKSKQIITLQKEQVGKNDQENNNLSILELQLKQETNEKENLLKLNQKLQQKVNEQDELLNQQKNTISELKLNYEEIQNKETQKTQNEVEIKQQLQTKNSTLKEKFINLDKKASNFAQQYYQQQKIVKKVQQNTTVAPQNSSTQKVQAKDLKNLSVRLKDLKLDNQVNKKTKKGTKLRKCNNNNTRNEISNNNKSQLAKENL